MFFKSKDKTECFGDFSCMDICPNGAIIQTIGDDSFLYPKIEKDLCIGCGLCEKVCTNIKNIKMKKTIECFSGKINDDISYKKSSSGGAFEAIVRSIYSKIKKDGTLFVAGAIWDENLQVKHIVKRMTEKIDLECFYKSKYIQSNSKGIYVKIKEILADLKNVVVFSGTPCQIVGLYSFLNDIPNNLITIDLICRGGQSQENFNKYKYNLEKSNKSCVVKYIFRNKEQLDNGTIYSRSAKICFANGLEKKVTYKTDEFLKEFYLKTYKQRYSCRNCKYSNKNRVGDFTIGDAWGIEEYINELNSIQGCSLLMCNSPVAISYINDIKRYMKLFNVEYQIMVDNNAGLKGIKRNE